ncbi:MAG TPA: hypothetical protein VNA57_08045 [Acidimicrobiales bacterium]|nr:hypothetical protein [Acidimicrobiales bacterium]
MEQNNVSTPDAPRQRPAVSHFHAGYNQPGYLPEADPEVHRSFEAARQALAADLDLHATAEDTWADEHDCDDIACATYGQDHQLAGDLAACRDELVSSQGPEWSGSAAGLAYWITSCEEAGCLADWPGRR